MRRDNLSRVLKRPRNPTSPNSHSALLHHNSFFFLTRGARGCQPRDPDEYHSVRRHDRDPNEKLNEVLLVPLSNAVIDPERNKNTINDFIVGGSHGLRRLSFSYHGLAPRQTTGTATWTMDTRMSIFYSFLSYSFRKIVA